MVTGNRWRHDSAKNSWVFHLFEYLYLLKKPCKFWLEMDNEEIVDVGKAYYVGKQCAFQPGA